MSAVSVTGVGISASCPGTIAVNTPASSVGTVNYTLVNSGAEDAVVNILAQLIDSAGNHIDDSRMFLSVAAGESSDFNHALQLNASYAQSGRVTVTMRIEVSGDATLLDSTNCDFVVAEP